MNKPWTNELLQTIQLGDTEFAVADTHGISLLTTIEETDSFSGDSYHFGAFRKKADAELFGIAHEMAAAILKLGSGDDIQASIELTKVYEKLVCIQKQNPT